MEIRITWQAFGDQPDRNRYVRSTVISAPSDFQTLTDLEICERVFQDTNLYTGSLWDRLKPVLPEDRTHTGLCVGDGIEIDGRKYLCASLGFTPYRPTSKAQIEALSADPHISGFYKLTDAITVAYIDADYGPGCGSCYWESFSGRCGRCDARYCTEVCNAGAPGYVYVVGEGWVTTGQGWQIVEQRDAEGLNSRIEFYPNSFDLVEAL